MARLRDWTEEQGFEAYYLAKDATNSLSYQDIAKELKKDYGKEYSKMTVGRIIDAIAELLASDISAQQRYAQFKATMNQARYFYRFNADGMLESPYPTVRRAAEKVLSKNKYYTKGFKEQLRKGEKFWQFIGKKDPEKWDLDDYYKYAATVPQGSQFGTAVALRAFSPILKAVDGMTDGLKGAPRIPAILKSKEFPQLFVQWKRKVLELTPYELREEMEFVLRTKPATGMRTGDRRTARGLFGTKIGGAYKNEHNENGSYIQVAGQTLIWHVNEKKKEEWDINFLSPDLRAYIINYVKQRKVGDYLLDKIKKAQVNKFFKQASDAMGFEKLVMHDMRKVSLTFLNRAGIPLEKAITVNVGWKDIGTAFKHYLALSDLGEKELEYQQKFTNLLDGKATVAGGEQ